MAYQQVFLGSSWPLPARRLDAQCETPTGTFDISLHVYDIKGQRNDRNAEATNGYGNVRRELAMFLSCSGETQHRKCCLKGLKARCIAFGAL